MRMMNEEKKRLVSTVVIIMLIFLIVLSTKGGMAYASETSGNVKVSYVKEVSEAYPLTIKVSGLGTVTIDEDNLRDTTSGYLLFVDEVKKIKFIPDTNLSIKSVKLNDDEVISDIKDGELVIRGMEKGQILIVEFSQGSGYEPQPQSMSGIKTGDMANIMYYIGTVLLSLIVIFSICKDKDE